MSAAALVERDVDGLETLRDEWDALAEGVGNPFLTVAWLASWWRAFADDRGLALVLHGEDGRLRAGACFLREPDGTLAGLANVHTNDWDVVAVDDQARRDFWTALAARRERRLRLPYLFRADDAATARTAVAANGYRVVEQDVAPSPWLALPASFDDLVAGRSRNLRSQIGRRRRALEREGELELTLATGGPQLERELGELFEIEASGWKGREGTAISADAATEAMYRGFARAAADAGWMRLYMLRLDGRPVAGDYGCAFGGCGYLIKTGFDEQLERFAPGLVLRAEVLRASIDEGLERYDFLGGPDGYKLRWTDELRGRTTLRAYRGPAGIAPYVWWSSVRPALKRVRDDLRERRAGGSA